MQGAAVDCCLRGSELHLCFEPALQQARDFYLGLARRVGGAVLVLEPEGSLFADELARVSPRVVCANRSGEEPGQWRMPGARGVELALAPLGALESVGSSGERTQLLKMVFERLKPGGVFALDLQLPSAAKANDGVSRLVAERRDKVSRKIFWENSRFETGSSRLERRLAVEELTGDGTVRKKRYHRSVVLSLVEPEKFGLEAKAAGFSARQLSGESLCGANATGQRHLWLLTRQRSKSDGQSIPSTCGGGQR